MDFCGGLKHTLPLFDTVERLDPQTSRASVGKMLKKANITSIHFDTLYPPKGSGATGHETGAARSVERHYNNPQYVGIVVNFFYEDYNLLNIPLPDFAVDALLELNRTGDEFRLQLERLERLLQITANITGRGILQRTANTTGRGEQQLLNESVVLHTNVAEDISTIGKVQANVILYILAIGLFALVLLFVRRQLFGLTDKRAKSI